MGNNFFFDATYVLIQELNNLILVSSENMNGVPTLDSQQKGVLADDSQFRNVIEETKKFINYCVKASKTLFANLNCPHIDDATERLENFLTQPFKWAELNTRARALRNAIQIELKEYLYYQYPKHKGQKVRDYIAEWEPVYSRFENARNDIFHGVDCWAMGQDTASVFHMMRVLEIGLQWLANNVGATASNENWQNIIDQIEKRIHEMQRELPRGRERNERLQFLSEAAKEFRYFKDGWRNYVSHGKGRYNEQEAYFVLQHVNSFMIALANQTTHASV